MSGPRKCSDIEFPTRLLCKGCVLSVTVWGVPSSLSSQSVFYHRPTFIILHGSNFSLILRSLSLWDVLLLRQLFKNSYSFLFYVYEWFCLRVAMCTICMQCPWRPEEGLGIPGTGVAVGYGQPWEFARRAKSVFNH